MSLAAQIQRDLGIEARIEPGPAGQLSILADGELIAERARGFFARHIFGGGWPSGDEVVKKLSARRAR